MPEGDTAAREEQLHACHQRSADKLLKLCFDNGGIYIKLGQHIGQLVSPFEEKGWGPQHSTSTSSSSRQLHVKHVVTCSEQALCHIPSQAEQAVQCTEDAWDAGS